MSQKNIESSKGDPTNDEISISQSQQQVESGNNGIVPSTNSSATNLNKKRLSFKDGGDEVQHYDAYSEEEETSTNKRSATNSGESIARGREMSEGALSNGPTTSEGGKSVAQSQQSSKPVIRGREMSEGVVSQGPAMSEGGRSVAQSQQGSKAVVRGREMSEGVVSNAPAMSEGGRSVAESQMTRNMARQMSEGAAPSEMAQPMSRQMSEGAANMSRVVSEGARSIPEGAMSRQMSEGAATLRSVRTLDGQSVTQTGFTSNWPIGGDIFINENGANPPSISGTPAPISNRSMMPIGPPIIDAAVIPRLQSIYDPLTAAINVDRAQIKAVAETREDREWVSKFEHFTVKFLNKIFRRAQHERKMRAAVQIPESCKNQKQQFNPYNSYPANPPPSAVVTGQQAQNFAGGPMPFQLFQPPAPVQAGNPGNNQRVPSEEEEEAIIVSELNSMLDDISKDISSISPEYLTLVTPLFGTLVELKGKDFRRTDNREIFHKIDDYHALIKCDTHICLESVMSRLQALVNFINVIKADSDNLKKFPRIITKCYETDSKICQEVCEVLSDDEFQTVNIKKMCKLKPKPPERPPWRLTYRFGDECFGSGKVRANTCSVSAPEKSCPLTGPARFSGGKTKSCGSKSRSISTCHTSPCCSSLGSKAAVRRYRSLSLNKPCPCSCCDSNDEIPNICGIYFTRFRDLKEDECPLMLEGLPTNEIFPSITNFDIKRQLNIPAQKLFLEDPKCCNPPPVEDACFGGKGSKWKKKFPCGARNACCNKDPCKSQRDPRSCCKRSKRKKRRKSRSCIKKQRNFSALAECQTSEIQLMPMPPTDGGGIVGADGIGDMSTLTPGEFTAKMVDMFGKAVEEGQKGLGYGDRSKEMADLARGLIVREGESALDGGGKTYNMNGMVATQTMVPPGQRQQVQQQTSQSQQNYTVQIMQAIEHEKCDSGQQTLPQQQLCLELQTRLNQARINKQAQTFQPSSYKANYDPLQKTNEMSNDQMAGMLANQLAPPHPAHPQDSASQQVFTNFIAQMYAAGNISRENASRMAGLVSNGFPLNRQEPGEGGTGGGGGKGVNFEGRPLSAMKGTQCTISKVQQMTTSQVQLVCTNAKSSRTVQITEPDNGFIPGSGATFRDGGGSQSFFTATKFYTSTSGTQLQHTRSFHGANGSYSQSMLCVTASKPSIQDMARCDSKHRPICIPNSKRSVSGIPRCNSQMRPARTIKSTKKDICVSRSQPSCPGIPRCPSGANSRPSCVTKSKPSMAGVPRCKSKPVCITKSHPSAPGLPRCVPAVPISGPIVDDGEPQPEPDQRPDEPENIPEPPQDNVPDDIPPPPPNKEDVPDDIPPPPPPFQEDVPDDIPPQQEDVPEPEDTPPPLSEKYVEQEEEAEPPRDPSVKTEKSPQNSEHTAPVVTPPLSDTPQLSPVLSASSHSRTPSSPSPVRTPSPASERSASISSKTPSLPPNNVEETTEEEEELEWPSTPPRGPLEKKPASPPELPPSPPPRRSKPGKNYHSPFKFQKVRPPEPPCETVLCDLPECHPLKTPYPPQYRFDEVRMRRYMEQCHQLKKICSHPQGEQCWTPPPPPLPPELRERKPPFPPDRCHPPLFPGTNLGMGCSYGLPSGNCYGQYEKGGNKKPEDCYFDCGGICPMGMLGETCPQKPPPYSKLKKKAKKDEVFTFDYITVMREKTGPEPEEEYCDKLKRQRRQQELQMMEAVAAAEQCQMEDTSVCPPRRGKSGRRHTRKSRIGCVDDDPEGPPPPSQEITRFLKRPDVQVVKEQKTEIVKKQGIEGPERLLTQMEAFYTKTPDGRIATELKDTGGNNNNSQKPSSVDHWMKQEADATLRKHNRGMQPTDECPMLQTDWEKEFKDFAKSCGRSKNKGKEKPLPPGFIPCPLPERTTIMCRIPDPSSMAPGGSNVIQCQAVPIPTGRVGGNGMQFGTEGVCVGGGGGFNGMAGLSFLAPPVGYGGYVLQQPLQQVNQMFAQGLPPPPMPPQQEYQALLSSFPGGVPPPPPQSNQQQFQHQIYSQSQTRRQAEPQQQYQQQMYSPKPLSPAVSQPQQQMYSPKPLGQAGSQPHQQMYSLSKPLTQVGSQPQRTQWDADSLPPPPNGYDRYAPGQPVYGVERVTSNNFQEESRKSPDAPPSSQPEGSADYPYLCEIRYHEPIHGSIYGRVVTRKQPCRLMDPNMVIPPGHNPNCPVIMETPFFNPSCRQKNPPQGQQSDANSELRKNP